MLLIFSCATCFACKSPNQTLSCRHHSAHRQGLHSAAITDNTQSQAFCEQSGTTSRVRALWSFLPVPGLQAAVPDAGPLRCNSTHRHAPPCCKQPRKSTMGFAHLQTWPREPRARRLACVPAGGSKPLETKRRGENNRKGEFWYKKSSMIKMRQIVPGSAVG